MTSVPRDRPAVAPRRSPIEKTDHRPVTPAPLTARDRAHARWAMDGGALPADEPSAEVVRP